jgi:hypothetical protein
MGPSRHLKPDLPVTITFAINHDCTPGERCHIFENDADPSRYSGIVIQIIGDQRLEASYGDGGVPSSNNRRSGFSATRLAPGTWYDVAVVIKGAGDFEFHFDGIRDDPGSVTYSGAGAPMVYLDKHAQIGNTGSLGSPFRGVLDEFRLYDRALGEGEIAGLRSCIIDGLRGAWPLDGNAVDATTCGNDGSAIGPLLTSGHDGNPNSAYAFINANDYIDLGASAVLKPQFPLTLAMWIRNECAIGDVCELFHSGLDAGIYSGVRVALAAGNELTARYGDGGTPSSLNRRSVAGVTPIPNGWHHIATVIRGPRDFELYIDGVRDLATYSGSGGPLYYGTSPSTLGASAGSHQGAIDDLHLYARALSAEEIRALPEPGFGFGIGGGVGMLLWGARRRRRRRR